MKNKKKVAKRTRASNPDKTTGKRKKRRIDSSPQASSKGKRALAYNLVYKLASLSFRIFYFFSLHLYNFQKKKKKDDGEAKPRNDVLNRSPFQANRAKRLMNPCPWRNPNVLPLTLEIEKSKIPKAKRDGEKTRRRTRRKWKYQMKKKSRPNRS